MKIKLKQWFINHMNELWKLATWSLVILSIIAVITTITLFTTNPPFGPSPTDIIVMLSVDTVLLLLLAVMVVRRILKLRSYQTKSRLHSRLVTLFSIVSVTPSIVVIILSVLLLNLGIEEWFSKRVKTALNSSLAVAEAYLGEHQKSIGGDIKALANDLNQNAFELMGDPNQFANFLKTQLLLRSLSEISVFDSNQTIIARTGLIAEREEPLLLTKKIMTDAQNGDLIITTNAEKNRVYAIIQLPQFVDAYLYIARPIDATVLEHTRNTKKAVIAYNVADQKRSFLQYAVLLVIAVVGLLLLLISVSIGLRLASKIVRPIRDLAQASQKIQSGDLNTRVTVPKTADELQDLSITFNQMMDSINNQSKILAQAQRAAAWSDVARTLAHEIKNPLTPIQLSTERMQRRLNKLELTPDTKIMVNECTDTILRQTDNIMRLVNEFSGFARMPTANKQTEDLVKIINNTITLYRSSYPQLKISFDSNQPIVQFQCDAGLMQQLFTNLFKNALESMQEKYNTLSHEKTIINCLLSSQDNEIRIEISDTGKGFSDINNFSSFFEPYHTTKTMGTGLGLSVVQKIIDEHGGNIALSNTINSENQTKGAFITIILPNTKSDNQGS